MWAVAAFSSSVLPEDSSVLEGVVSTRPVEAERLVGARVSTVLVVLFSRIFLGPSLGECLELRPFVVLRPHR